MMNLNQTKSVGLTMELDLKTREYKKLCNKLDDLKENKIDPNDERFLVLKELFQKNHDDIVKINSQIKELQVAEKLKEKQRLEKYNLENVFNKKNNVYEIKKEENMNVSIVQTKKNIFTKFIEKIKSLLKNKV